VLSQQSRLRHPGPRPCVGPPDQLTSAEPATIEIPLARRFQGKELTIIDSSGMGFLVIPSDGDIVYGDIAMRSAVRLVPLVGDDDDEPDGWGVV
jgi:hypothetical protein